MTFISEHHASNAAYLASVDNNGSEYKYVLSDGTINDILTVNPAGWNDLGLHFRRHDFYHGILRSVTLSLRFPRTSGGGWDFIVSNYLTYGIEANVTVDIYEKNGQTDDYDILYSGILDFNASYSIERDFFEIPIKDGSKEHKFSSRDKINYNLYDTTSTDNTTITSFASAPHDITFEPVDIYRKYNGTGTSGFDSINSATNTLTNYLFGINETNTVVTDELGNTSLIDDRDFLIFDNVAIPDDHVLKKIYVNDIKELATVTIDLAGTYSLQADSTVASNFSIDLRYYVVHKDVAGVVVSTSTLATYSGSGTDTYTTSGTMTLTTEVFEVQVDQWLELYGTISISSLTQPMTMDMDFTISNLNVSELTTGDPASTVKSFYAHDASSRLIQLMTSETDSTKLLYSDILGKTTSEFRTYASNGFLSENIITNGRAIRGFPTTAIPVNFRDTFKTLDAFSPLGLHYDRTNERFVIEDRENYYDDTTFMFGLGDVKELVIKPYSKAYFGKIKTGYKNKIILEELNGANEVNIPTEHTISIAVKDELDLQSRFHGGSIPMELTRRKPYLKWRSTDTRNDENTFIVDTLSGSTVQGGTSVAGFDGVDQLYNLKYLPRENLLRHIPEISPALWKSTNSIRFSNSQKDINISYDNQNGTNVNEQDEIVANEFLTGLYYQPEIHKFEAAITAAMITQLNTNPHGYVTYTFNSVAYAGFIEEVETLPYNKTAIFTVLPQPSISGNILLMEDGSNFALENDSLFEIE